MAVSNLACPHCSTPWPLALRELAALEHCPGCRRATTVEVFPALTRPPARGAGAETVMADGEAACFYHAEKRAVAPCAACGRFLCALCDMELNGDHLCPACLEAGRRKGRLAVLDSRRPLHDSAALTLAVVPALLCWPVTVFTAPAAIGLAVYGWNRPGSLIPRRRWRAGLAMVLGAVEFVVSVVVIYYFVLGGQRAFYFIKTAHDAAHGH